MVRALLYLSGAFNSCLLTDALWAMLCSIYLSEIIMAMDPDELTGSRDVTNRRLNAFFVTKSISISVEQTVHSSSLTAGYASVKAFGPTCAWRNHWPPNSVWSIRTLLLYIFWNERLLRTQVPAQVRKEFGKYGKAIYVIRLKLFEVSLVFFNYFVSYSRAQRQIHKLGINNRKQMVKF